MKKPLEISYAFTREGVAAFLDTALADTFHAIRSADGVSVPPIEIVIGSRRIAIPMLPEQYEELSEYLNNAITLEEEEQC